MGPSTRNARAMVSGPMPAGSPWVMAIGNFMEFTLDGWRHNAWRVRRLGRVVNVDKLVRQAPLLRHMGCEYGQGFYFSRPVAAPIAEAMISKQYEAERHLRRG